MDDEALEQKLLELNQRLSAIEDKVDFVLQKLKLEYHDKSDWFQPEDEILQLAKSGRKIEAIKKYREKYNVGLKEAKDAVERMEGGGG